MSQTLARYETRHAGGDAISTHRHRAAYAALVIAGDHTECSADGRFECEPGTLLLHPAFHAHGNRFGRRGAVVLNVALPDLPRHATLVALRVDDLREARRVFEHADRDALSQLIATTRPARVSAMPPWQAVMLQDLGASEQSIAQIAAQAGVSAAHASRSLLRSHGMGPLALRRELRWRHALSLLSSEASLADIAARSGFADQSHLHRIVRACSGMTPAQLRRQIKSVQDRERLTRVQ